MKQISKNKKNKITIILTIIGIGIVAFLSVLYLTNEKMNQVPEDFWNLTAQALDYKDHQEGKWKISVEENVKDHPKIFIQNIEENATVSYSFSENGISYIYDLQSTEDDYIINNEKMTITSTDSDYKKYSVDYMNVIYHGPLYFDTITASGNITVQNDGSVIFDDTPFLKEMMERERTLIQEFEDKFKQKGLEIITTMPENEVTIEADSRYMYRVVDNIYSNIAKYALDNSRVYIDIKVDGKQVLISFKNISKEKLNISIDELMERFVRGDKSRTTEGSGLGLSISKSLTELQNGKFDVQVDGDLFKVELVFTC